MQPRLSPKNETAMTLFEVGVVLAIVLILLAVLLPALRPAVRKSSKINCTNNLKQLGLAYRIWEGDNNDIYPAGVSITRGGAMELVQTGNVAFVFEVMSNELSTPKILLCPMDTAKNFAFGFSGLANSNISYFAGVDVTNEVNPRLIISGDGNFEIRAKPVKPGLLWLWTNDPVEWDATRHVRSGNLGFADGSVQSASSAGLRLYFLQTGRATNRLAIP